MLSRKALEGIASYQYKAGTYTALDNLLNPFWTKCAEYLPIWMAPNLITLIGTCSMFLSTSLQIYYSPQFTAPSPRFVSILSALSLFFYQTMDALDGKQARRTNTSSPLGQLFDHGCDALCTSFMALSAIVTVQFGSGLASLIVLSTLSIAFFMAQLEEYHTGVMSSGNGLIGVTEGQLLLVFLHLMAAVFGNEIYSTVLIIAPVHMTLADILLVSLVTSNFFLTLSNVQKVLYGKSRLSGPAKGDKEISRYSAALQSLPISLLLILSYAWVSGPRHEVYQNYPILYLFPIGIAYVLLSTQMMVCHMCKCPFSLSPAVFAPFVLMIINDRMGTPLVRPIIFVTESIIILVAMYAHYVTTVMLDICNHLGISPFKITKRQN